MNILVCIKQVPGTTQVEVDPVTGVLKRDGVMSKLNPYDLFAVETALSLRNRYGGSVRCLSMGPPQAAGVIREAVCMGADGGTLVCDRSFAGSDVLATAYTLSQAIRKLGEIDLILCGKQTTDGDTAQVGAEISEFLSIPHASNVLSVECGEPGSIDVRCDLGSSIVSERIPLPCLLCVDAEINTPRLPSYVRKKACRTEVETLILVDLEDTDKAHYGLSGSPTQVERIFPPEVNDSKEILRGEPEALADKIADILRQRKFI